MQGVTTAIVACIFAGLIWPQIVKSKAQFNSAIGLVMLILLLDAIGHMSAPDTALPHVMYVLSAIIQMLTILVLVMCIGGMSPRELAGEVSETIDTLRHGEKKPVLVPLKGEQPLPRAEPPAPARQTITLDEDDDSIPLE